MAGAGLIAARPSRRMPPRMMKVDRRNKCVVMDRCCLLLEDFRQTIGCRSQASDSPPPITEDEPVAVNLQGASSPCDQPPGARDAPLRIPLRASPLSALPQPTLEPTRSEVSSKVYASDLGTRGS